MLEALPDANVKYPSGRFDEALAQHGDGQIQGTAVTEHMTFQRMEKRSLRGRSGRTQEKAQETERAAGLLLEGNRKNNEIKVNMKECGAGFRGLL